MTAEDVYELALRRIMSPGCDNSTSGLGSCFAEGRYVLGADMVSSACPSCIAHRALNEVADKRVLP